MSEPTVPLGPSVALDPHAPFIPRARFHKEHVAALFAGGLFFLAFFGLTETASALVITFVSPMTYASPGEALFWLGHVLLLFPGACLIGFGLGPWLAPRLLKAWQLAEGMDRRTRIAVVMIIFLFAAGAARLSHRVILCDYPITDDEYATQFGGQVLALGKALFPAPEPWDAFSTLFLTAQDGKVTSFDWPGVQVAWAISEVTHSGPWIYALAAAAAALCLTLLMGLRLSMGYGIAAFVFFFFSPMAFTLSATTHAHLLSRALLALTLLLFVKAEKKRTWDAWYLVGLAAGFGFFCRPVEIVFLLLPLFLDVVFRSLRGTGHGRAAFYGILIGAAGPLLLFALHNRLVTGDFLQSARLSLDGSIGAIGSGTIWNRFGANAGFNLFMLIVWFLGPLGLILAALGALTDRFTRLLTLGLAAVLGSALIQNNQGLHIVGPIHYSECAVPLTVLAVHGLANLRKWLAQRKISFRAPAAMLAAALALGLGTFIVWQGIALNRQAQNQKVIYGRIEKVVGQGAAQKSVVLAPRFRKVWENVPEFKNIGGWVFQWRRARPDLSDWILIVHDVPGAEEALRKRFPERKFFRLRNVDGPPYFEIEALERPAP